MKVAFRVDASLVIGTGHVMRCLTLADALHARGARIRFVCREHPGHLCRLIEERGYEVAHLPGDKIFHHEEKSNLAHAHWLGSTQEADASATLSALADNAPWDWLVVDHYALSAKWEKKLHEFAHRIFVIDDLADRDHDCELLLDQAASADDLGRYAQRVPAHTRVLLGLAYALLRPEFSRMRARQRKRDGQINRLLIFFGGSDPTDQTTKSLRAIEQIGHRNFDVDVIIGASNPRLAALVQYGESLSNVEVHAQVNDMAEYMAAADLALGAVGSASWERCCLGLPSVLVTIAENQKNGLPPLLKNRAGLYLGEAVAVSVAQMERVLRRLSGKPALLRRLGDRAARLVDGQGTERVMAYLTAGARHSMRISS